MERISSYLNALKTRSGYTLQQLSEKTNIPQGTLPKYFGSMNDDSANFEIVHKLVVAMDGSLDELAGIAPKQPEISEEKLTEDGYTESEIRAILRWAGSEISRNYQAIIAGLESRLAEKDARISHRSDMIAEEQRRAQEEISHERNRARTATVMSYIALGLFVVLFFVDFLIPTRGWIVH